MSHTKPRGVPVTWLRHRRLIGFGAGLTDRPTDDGWFEEPTDAERAMEEAFWAALYRHHAVGDVDRASRLHFARLRRHGGRAAVLRERGSIARERRHMRRNWNEARRVGLLGVEHPDILDAYRCAGYTAGLRVWQRIHPGWCRVGEPSYGVTPTHKCAYHDV